MTVTVKTSNIDIRGADNVASVSTDTTFTSATRGIYIGVTGNIRLMTTSSTVATFTNVPAGTVLPVRAIRVLSSATTATELLKLW